MPAGDELRYKTDKCRTPIVDFMEDYAGKQGVRAHMPGHKGSASGSFATDMDITEISGADSLYEADGIILESENNASVLFGTKHSFYVTEGSSQAIKAMCLLAIRLSRKQAGNEKKKPVIIAGRNAHRSFVSAAELLGFETKWLTGENRASLMECRVTPEMLEEKLAEAGFGDEKFLAGIYITSPDYLGNMADIKALAEVAHRHGTLLLVDNAHGSYLRFLKKDRHPVTLGADLVCDSAHKTLPVLTGGAYLHVSKRLKKDFDMTEVRQALLRFGSTSPSYLILRSLDLANAYLAENATVRYFDSCVSRVESLKRIYTKQGIVFCGDEPMKICIDMKRSGFPGDTASAVVKSFREDGIEPEFGDEDYIILMLSPFNKPEDFEKIFLAMEKIGAFKTQCTKNSADVSGRKKSEKQAVDFSLPQKKYEPCEVLFEKREKVKLVNALGRIALDVPVSCPPAILPVIPGEVVDENIIKILKYYGIKEIYVKKSI